MFKVGDQVVLKHDVPAWENKWREGTRCCVTQVNHIKEYCYIKRRGHGKLEVRVSHWEIKAA